MGVSNMKLHHEFMDFLKEYKIIGLAIAFVMGTAATALVTSFVNNIIMPLIAPLLPAGDWQKAILAIGPFQFGVGAFLAGLINFIIIAFVIFMVAKMVLKEEKVSKK
jgi:large conductance mechanosensitive channel